MPLERSYTKVTRSLVQSVKRLSLAGMPAHTIAKNYNMSRETVKRILDGERDHVTDETPSISEKHPYPDVPRSGVVDPINTRRCGACGGRVQKNRVCYLCYLRSLKERTKATTTGDRHDATSISHSGDGRDMQANESQRSIEATDR